MIVKTELNANILKFSLNLEGFAVGYRMIYAFAHLEWPLYPRLKQTSYFFDISLLRGILT